MDEPHPRWIKIKPALYEPCALSTEGLVARYESPRGQQVLPHRLGSVAVLNAVPGPRYSLIRLNNRISTHDQMSFVAQVDSIHTAGLHTRTTHQGVDFHQWWLGVWARYSTFPYLTKDTRDRRAGPSIRTLLDLIDSTFGRRVLPQLRQLDPPTAASMSNHHRDLAEITISKAKDPSVRDSHMMKRNAPFIDSHPELQTNTAFRMGGMGSVMAVAWGEGTTWHYDQKNDSELRRLSFLS